VDLIVERAKATGKNTDPVVRQEVVKLLSLARAPAGPASARRRRACSAGRRAEGSLGKLYASQLANGCARVHTLISGTDSLLHGADGPLEGIIGEILLSVPAVSLTKKTDEIQRNIVSERVLGLPKDPAIEVDKPFRDVPKNLSGRR
jgi:alkylation response protein AidB-like acyl-CoA dehydrogenase